MLSQRASVAARALPRHRVLPRRHATSSAAAAVAPAVERVRFNDGSATSFAPLLNGAWTLAGGHGRVDPAAFMLCLTEHMAAGLTTLDTADIYGPSEAIIGACREALMEANPGSAPPEVFTKYVPNVYQSRPTRASVEAAVARSCKALRCETLDVVQLHWWAYDVPGMVDTALWLTELRAAGRIGSVGTTNLDCAALQQLLDAGVPVVCNQVQLSLLDRRALNGMTALCAAHDIKLLTYGTVAGGLLTDRHVAAPSRGLLGPRYPPVSLDTSSLKMYNRNVSNPEGWRALLRTLRAVADAHAVTVAAVALRWAMDQGPVHPIVGMRNASHIADNLAALTLTLTPDDRGAIDDALRSCPSPAGDIYSMERS